MSWVVSSGECVVCAAVLSGECVVCAAVSSGECLVCAAVSSVESLVSAAVCLPQLAPVHHQPLLRRTTRHNVT